MCRKYSALAKRVVDLSHGLHKEVYHKKEKNFVSRVAMLLIHFSFLDVTNSNEASSHITPCSHIPCFSTSLISRRHGNGERCCGNLHVEVITRAEISSANVWVFWIVGIRFIIYLSVPITRQHLPTVLTGSQLQLSLQKNKTNDEAW